MGVVSGVQRFLCRSCGRSFRNARRPARLKAALWDDFVYQRKTTRLLAKERKRSVNWIRHKLRAYQLPRIHITPCPIVAVIDCVFFGRVSGYLVVRDPHSRQNVYWARISGETIAEYQRAKACLEAQGFAIKAVVTDGKPGARGVFGDSPTQMCHFHQKAIITRYLTLRPKLEAGKELKAIVQGLCEASEETLSRHLASWHEKWREFISERTINPDTGRWSYTHKRLRAAYRSLKTNIPYLFTYQRHTGLRIPNTTNSLEGAFAHLKELVKIHRGIKDDLKQKMIACILQNRHRKK